MRSKVFLITVVLFGFACKSQKDNKAEEKPLESASFQVSSIEGESVMNEVTINIDTTDHKISGNTGCNTFGADFITDKNTIKIGYATVTKRYCEEQMGLEKKFLNSLKETGIYSYNGQELRFKSPENKTLLIAKQKENE